MIERAPRGWGALLLGIALSWPAVGRGQPQNPPVGAPEPPPEPPHPEPPANLQDEQGHIDATFSAPGASPGPAQGPAASPASPPPAPAPAAAVSDSPTARLRLPPETPIAEAPATQAPSRFRFEFHGYARMPLSLEGTPRVPFLIDNDYYLSGFAYTRLYETDWSELYLSAHYGDAEVVFGMFASLFSDWGGIELQDQWGIAQASVRLHEVLGLEPLSIEVGMFWDRMGYIEPYDTYVFGRTHQAGAKARWELDSGAALEIAFGAHRESLQQNQGLTPVAHLHASVPVGSFELGAYVLRAWTRDKRELSPIEDGDFWSFGADVRWETPLGLGPVYLAAAYYDCSSCLFLAPALEVLHSTGGRGLTENFLGLESSNNGTGKFLVAGLDFPARLSRLVPGLELRLFGMMAWVRSDQVDASDPALNRDRRLYLKWGIEPAYAILPWLKASLRFDRVILDFQDAENSFHVISPRVTFALTDWAEIFAMYSRYLYGDKIHLRPGQVPLVSDPDEGVFKLQAQARW